MESASRRHDIDWLRVIAIGLLLLYHTAVPFQPWGAMIGFITNPQSWEKLWILMKMLNVWRIPLLFYVSGMGVYFSMQSRNWKQLIWERATRIFLPFIFGCFFIIPIQTLIWFGAFHMPGRYVPGPGHLWFLSYLFLYVLICSGGFIYLKNNQHARFTELLKKVFGHRLSFVLLIIAFVTEAILVNPFIYEQYANTWHGFILGLMAFLFGFCFAFSGFACWGTLRKWKWAILLIAILFYAWRTVENSAFTPNYLIAIESSCWILSLFGFANQYLNRPSKWLNYFSRAAYPIYIIHMLVLFIGSMALFPLPIPVYAKFTLLLFFTTIGSWILYEFVIRRLKIIRPLFGLRRNF